MAMNNAVKSKAPVRTSQCPGRDSRLWSRFAIIWRAPGSPNQGLAKPGQSWKVGSMDVAARPVVEATVADAVRTSVVTRNYY